MRNQTNLRLFTTLFATLVSGCIIHDNDCERSEDDLSFDTGQEDPGSVDQPSFSLSPDQGLIGDTFIASIAADDEVDFSEVNEVFFLGDVTICTTQARQGELLMTVSIDEQASQGAVDLVIGFEDGTAYLINDALFLSDDGAFGGDTDSQNDDPVDDEGDGLGDEEGEGTENNEDQDSEDLGEGGCG